jgi:hypothetical protein
VKDTRVANNFALRALDGSLMAIRDTVGDCRRNEEAKMFEQFGDEGRTAINTDDARICKHRRYVEKANCSSFGGTVFGGEDPNIS